MPPTTRTKSSGRLSFLRTRLLYRYRKTPMQSRSVRTKERGDSNTLKETERVPGVTIILYYIDILLYIILPLLRKYTW